MTERILWLDTAQNSKRLEKKVLSEFNIKIVSDLETFEKEFLDFDAFIVDSGGLRSVPRLPHDIKPVVYILNSDHEDLSENDNLLSFSSLIDARSIGTKLSSTLKKDIEFKKREEKAALEQKLLATKNKKLETEVLRLEDIDKIDDKDIERSKEDISNKQKKTRSLISFVNGIGHTETAHDLIDYIRKELKVIHQVSEPILSFVSAANELILLHYQNKKIVNSRATTSWSASKSIRVNDLEDRKYLANQLGRPFGNVISIPLLTTTSYDSSPAILFLEHHFQEHEMSAFLEAISERLQPLSTALDRILIGDHLRAGALHWEKTFDAIRDPIGIVDIDFFLLRSNSHFSAYPQKNKCYEQFSGASSMCSGCPIPDAIATGEHLTSDIRVKNKIYEVHAYPIKWKGDSSATTVVSHYFDVTEARNLYGEMVQNEKMAALGHLASNIAHELNNPLTGIRSLSQILMQTLENEPELKSDLHEIEKAAERSQKIIRNLLEFTDRKLNHNAVISINEVVSSTMPLLKTAIRMHNSEIVLSEQSGQVRADFHLLQQVVFNLINNACQAMQENGTVRVETETTKGWVEIRVKDSGPGIDPSILDRIFDPFFTTKPKGEGTGLGLSMSRSIIEKYGGKLTVQSAVGEGTQFVVSLPEARDSL